MMECRNQSLVHSWSEKRGRERGRGRERERGREGGGEGDTCNVCKGV